MRSKSRAAVSVCMLLVCMVEPVVRRTSPFDLYLSLLAVSVALIVHRV